VSGGIKSIRQTRGWEKSCGELRFTIWDFGNLRLVFGGPPCYLECGKFFLKQVRGQGETDRVPKLLD